MSYTPGYSENAIRFMERRTLDIHGDFVRPWLPQATRILDAGCGPGSITLDVAERFPEATVVGLDREESQLEIARSGAAKRGVKNVSFAFGSLGENWNPLFEAFDLVYSHAVFEHVPNPIDCLRQLHTSLSKNGIIALKSPDWGGFVLYPETRECREAFDAYETIQKANGGDTHAGRKLGAWLREAGFVDTEVTATYEVYRDVPEVAEYLALRLEYDGESAHAEELRNWACHRDAFFAQTWIAASGRKAKH